MRNPKYEKVLRDCGVPFRYVRNVPLAAVSTKAGGDKAKADDGKK